MTGPRPSAQRSPRICLLGAPGDTGNLGVTALHQATISGLAERLPDADITVFDNGFGVREGTFPAGPGQGRLRSVGLRPSRRIHRPESLARIRISARLGSSSNPVVRAIASADVVLDISGGDSFSDLYRRRQQRLTVVPKQLVMRLGRPLVLLPQTYGPFSGPRARQAAVAIVRAAEAAWARDRESYSQLQELLGPAFVSARHHAGVDVAFSLSPKAPSVALSPDLDAWRAPSRAVPLAGVNVSGLLYNRADAATRFGLRLDYARLMRELVRRLLDGSRANVVLLPHVLGVGPESDDRAVAHLWDALPPEHRARVAVAPELSDPGEVKWLISQLDWFCGTRMHSTIAALSSTVPSAVVAYSPKARGVFATCGMAREVVDARRLDERTALQELLGSWERREEVQRTLRRHLPTTLRRGDEQMDAIVARVLALAVTRTEPRARSPRPPTTR